jgi:hypothetical protein
MPGNDNGPLGERAAINTNQSPAAGRISATPSLIQTPHITDDMAQPDAALAMAAAGMYVFPVDHPELPQCAGIGQGHNPKTCNERGKHPAVAFTTAADINPKMIHMWWAGPPRNIGINCGKSGLVVIDEDVLGAFKRYADEHGVKIPPTMVVRTSKGRHYYFVAPADIQLGNKEGALKDYSIDVRAGNAYVVGPGSLHQTGVTYRIEVALPPAPLPDWVVQAIKAKSNGQKVDDDGVVWDTVGGDFDRFELPEVIKDQTRDTTLFQYASSLLARELPRHEAEVLMRSAWQRCEQPPKAKDTYTVEEALAKLDRYEPGRSEGYEKGGSGEATESRRRLVLTSAATIKPKRVKWLWVDRLALGTLALLAGGEGLGKSTIAYDRCARVTRGELEGEFHEQPKGVLVCATEDSWEHTIVPRLIAHGADLTKVFRVEVLDEEVHGGLILPRDIKAVEAAAAQVDAAILLLDPLMSRIDKKIDSHKDQDVRLALEPVAALAIKSNLCVWGIIHHNKSGSSDPLQLIMASKAFAAVARSVHTVVKDPDDENKRLFGMPKNNLGRTDLDTLVFTVASHAIDTDEGIAWTGRIEWGGISDTAIGEAMKQRATQEDDNGATSEAAEWLKVYMISMGGSKESAKVKAAGKAAGHSEAAVKRAKNRLNISHRNRGFPSKTWWFMPGADKGDPAVISQLSPVGSPPGESDLTGLTEPTGAVGSVGSVGSIGSRPPEADPAAPVDLVSNDHAPPPNPVLTDGAVQLDLISDLEPDAVKEVAPVARTNKRQKVGACAGCGERMTITEDGQTTHPGCEVAQ